MQRLSEHLNKPEEHQLRDLLLLTLLFGCLFLGFLGTAPLIDPDEGRYAEIPREMLEKNDYITPTLNYVKYFEKPPLIYWANAVSMALLGQTEYAARLPSALSGLLTVLVTYLAGRSLFDRRTGLIAALILGSTAGFLIQSRIILTDMLLTLCLTAALFAFAAAARSEGTSRCRLYQLFFVFCGLAVLTKGLIGIVLPAGIIFWYVLIFRQWRMLRDIPWLSGGMLFFAVTAPWFALVSHRNPEFLQFFFIHEHFDRFTSKVHGRYQPFWFFLPILLLTMLPWSFMLPASLRNAWRERFNSKGSSLFLIIWPLVILCFFSLSSSKLIPYILPMFPPLALLLALFLASSWISRRPPVSTSTATLGLLLITSGIIVALLPQLTPLGPWLHASGQTGRQLAQLIYSPSPILHQGIMLVAGLFLAVPGGILLLTLKTRSVGLLVAAHCLFGILLELLLPWLFSHYAAERLSPRLLARTALAHATPQTLLAQFGPQQGMNFYSRRRMVTVGDADELTFGSRQGDQKGWFMTQDAFRQLWLKQDHHILVVLKRHEVGLLGTQIPHRVLADNGTLLLLSNR